MMVLFDEILDKGGEAACSTLPLNTVRSRL